MKLVYLLFACLAPATFPQSNSSPSAPLKHQDELHFRALRVVQAERLREQQPLCPKAVTTIDVNSCYANELGITDGNYLTLARAIGAMLRFGEEPASGDKPVAIPFDTAEATWHAYRDQACEAAGLPYLGGTIRPSIEMGCRLTLTRHHIDELWSVYRDLGIH